MQTATQRRRAPRPSRARRTLARVVGVLVHVVVTAWCATAAAQAPTTDASTPATLVAAPPRASVDTTPAEAPKSKLEWRYPTFSTGEYVATGVFGALAVGGLAIPTTTARWTGANPIDDGARDSLRLGTLAARKTADDISDLTLTASLNYVLFDSLIVTWLGYDKGSVAYQMTAIDFEALAFTTGINSLVKSVAARQRPYGRACGADGSLRRTDDCDPSQLNRSFFSGHTSTAFTAASLTCMHHANLELYGGGGGDVAACVGAYAVATTTGVLRVMSDNHYLTDVTVGAAFGTVAGLGIPWLFHYRFDAPPPGPIGRRDGVSVRLIPGPGTATLIGEF